MGELPPGGDRADQRAGLSRRVGGCDRAQAEPHQGVILPSPGRQGRPADGVLQPDAGPAAGRPAQCARHRNARHEPGLCGGGSTGAAAADGGRSAAAVVGADVGGAGGARPDADAAIAGSDALRGHDDRRDHRRLGAAVRRAHCRRDDHGDGELRLADAELGEGRDARQRVRPLRPAAVPRPVLLTHQVVCCSCSQRVSTPPFTHWFHASSGVSA